MSAKTEAFSRVKIDDLLRDADWNLTVWFECSFRAHAARRHEVRLGALRPAGPADGRSGSETGWDRSRYSMRQGVPLRRAAWGSVRVSVRRRGGFPDSHPPSGEASERCRPRCARATCQRVFVLAGVIRTAGSEQVMQPVQWSLERGDRRIQGGGRSPRSEPLPAFHSDVWAACATGSAGEPIRQRSKAKSMIVLPRASMDASFHSFRFASSL